jgi:hypothetical protein
VSDGRTDAIARRSAPLRMTSVALSNAASPPRTNGMRGEVTLMTQPMSRAPMGVLPNQAI